MALTDCSSESSFRRICVTLPCYNEGIPIYDVVRSFQVALPGARIVVFDNRSQDNTAAEATRAGAEVCYVPLQGKGNVVRRIFADIDADVYLMADGDGTYDAEAAPKLVRHLVEHRLDMVVGKRRSVESDTYRNGHVFGNWLLTTCVSKLFGRGFDDMLSGYRVFSRRFAKSFPANAQGFEIETELTVHALRLRLPVSEVETSYFARPPGSHSKLNTYRDGLRILTTIIRLLKNERPLVFFGAVGTIAALLSVALAWPIWTEFVATGLVPRLPTAVLCASLGVVAVIAFVCGVLLEAVSVARLDARHASYLALPNLPPLGSFPAFVTTAPATLQSQPIAPNAASIRWWPTASMQTQAFALRLSFVIVLVAGVFAGGLGRQDFNWDLRNYHLYNAWAFWTNRIGRDLAPAMLQSYFNPLLDLPHYWLAVVLNWNARWVALVTGMFHGMAVVALLFIARATLAHDRRLSFLALVVTATGCLAGSWLMEFGTTMGDSSVAVLVLTAVAWMLSARAEASQRPADWPTIGAGLLVGAACGLKLTAAPFALGLLAITIVQHRNRGTVRPALARIATLLAATACGFAITGGWWHLRMWSDFGNPLFPQFNRWFASPLATTIQFGDQTPWHPQSIFEALAFPFVVVNNPTRISELRATPLLWPAVYLLALVALSLAVRKRWALPSEDATVRERQRAVLAFVVTSYVAWMVVFSIYRYSIAFEMLLPLVGWLLVAGMPISANVQRILRIGLIALAVVSALVVSISGRVDFARKSYYIEPPELADPARTTIVLVGGDPLAWLLTGFPKDIAAIGLATNFPESDAYIDRARQIIATRQGPVLALIAADSDSATETTSSAHVRDANTKIRRYGGEISENSCRAYGARAGRHRTKYQLCAVRFLVN